MDKDKERLITWINQRRAEKEKKRWKEIKRKRNIKRSQGKNKSISNSLDFISTREEIKLPQNCCFISETEEVNVIVNTVKTKVDSVNDTTRSVHLDMSEVIEIDSAGINVFLTLANYLASKGIKVTGVLPSDEKATEKIVRSGFLKMVTTKRSVPQTVDHIFILSGNDRTNQQEIGAEIRQICKTLLGEEQTYPPLYDTLGEIAANSVEHANTVIVDKNWFMSVHYEDDYAVIQMADIGEGILGTLKLLLKQEILSAITFQQSHETLQKLFEGQYQSCTLEPNRNNGLPDMLQRFKESYIDNVIVITNEAAYDFSGKYSRKLNNPFPGTFYSIRISKSNIQQWQNRLK